MELIVRVWWCLLTERILELDRAVAIYDVHLLTVIVVASSKRWRYRLLWRTKPTVPNGFRRMAVIHKVLYKLVDSLVLQALILIVDVVTGRSSRIGPLMNLGVEA